MKMLECEYYIKNMRYLLLPISAFLLLTGCVQAVEYKAPAQTGCEYQDATYRYGEIFPAADGFNTCSCANDGTVTCSEESSGNPAQCTTDTDCEKLNVDTSFCSNGSWTCRQGACDYSCDISDRL